MNASKIILLSYPIVAGYNQKPHYAPIRTQGVDELVDKCKYNEFLIIHYKLITLYSLHKSCSFDYMVLSYNNSPKYIIKIFLESLKSSHNVGLTYHANKSVMRSSQNNTISLGKFNKHIIIFTQNKLCSCHCFKML